MEGDEALEEERKKNLSILQSVLGSSQQNCNSTTGKAKTFRSATRVRARAYVCACYCGSRFTLTKQNMSVCRDVSALHYDPTREEHAAMETKTTANKDRYKHGNRRRAGANLIYRCCKSH